MNQLNLKNNNLVLNPVELVQDVLFRAVCACGVSNGTVFCFLQRLATFIDSTSVPITADRVSALI
jgi:hypothetical protein